MKNTFLPVVLLFALALFSCKKEKVDLDPAKRLKSLESEGTTQLFTYDTQRRLIKTQTTANGSQSVSTIDYSKSGQVIETIENSNNGSPFQTVNTMTLNGSGLVSIFETVSRLTTGTVTTITGRRKIENVYNKDNNLVSQTTSIFDINTGIVSTVITLETSYKKRNAVTQSQKNTSDGITTSEFKTTVAFGGDINTLGFSYRGVNYQGVASLNLATSTTTVITSFDRNNPVNIISTTENTTTNENFVDDDGYLTRRVATTTAKTTFPNGQVQTPPARVTTTRYSYE